MQKKLKFKKSQVARAEDLVEMKQGGGESKDAGIISMTRE